MGRNNQGEVLLATLKTVQAGEPPQLLLRTPEKSRMCLSPEGFRSYSAHPEALLAPQSAEHC